ncbi:MAG: hypothetical protein NV1_51 [Nanoarchaeotal virus 1]|nr:MAG: hypothetical protein NV1_51 [Nanoarchaeotal virus 1]
MAKFFAHRSRRAETLIPVIYLRLKDKKNNMNIAILTVAFVLALGAAVALIVISLIVPRGFNSTYKIPKAYKGRSYKRSYGRK